MRKAMTGLLVSSLFVLCGTAWSGDKPGQSDWDRVQEQPPAPPPGEARVAPLHPGKEHGAPPLGEGAGKPHRPGEEHVAPPPPVRDRPDPGLTPGPRQVPGKPGAPARPPRAAGPRHGPGEPFPSPWDPLIRLLEQRRPELAERLRRLEREDPRRLEEVLLNAFGMRLEEALERSGAGKACDMPRPERSPGRGFEGMAPPPPEGAAPCGPGFDQRRRELGERNEELERRSHELAERLRRAREEGVPPEEFARLKEELGAVVNEHFEVRTELRRVELERIERELQRLQETVERMQHDFERREREREAIIERRIRQLLGEDFGGW